MTTIKNLGRGVESVFIENNRFNTTMISVNFYLPLVREKIAAAALLPYLLTSCSAEYPDFSALNLKLLSLYSADIGGSADRVGDNQWLRFYCNVLNDDVVDEPVLDTAALLLAELIFNPLIFDGQLSPRDVAREKRLTAEKIKSLVNDKRSYAINRAISEMFRDEAWGTMKTGELDDVLNLTPGDVTDAWERMLKESFVRIQVVGKKMPAGLNERFAAAFAEIDRSAAGIAPARPKITQKVNEIKETAAVNQAKLVLGFTCPEIDRDGENISKLVFADLFGGGPYSRLFSVVREQMSLCYYCAARATRSKGFMLIDCGVDTENIKKAQDEILHQLEIIKSGDFSDELIKASAISLNDSLLTAEDSAAALDTWYGSRPYAGAAGPADVAELIKKINKSDIISAAESYRLDTVYMLLPEEEK